MLLGLSISLVQPGGRGVVATAIPVNTSAPVISGVRTVGQPLAVSGGGWDQPVTSYAYQWKKAGVSISGATGQTYVIQAGDAGAAITCVVTPTNSFGAGLPATSNSVTPAAALALSGSPASSATVGNAYSFTPTTAGGHSPYGYALTGALPAGLSFNATTGAISGSPTTVETASGLNITVTDVDGLTASLGVFSIAVTSSSVTLGALGLTPTTATAGSAYSGTITGATSGSTISATSSDGTVLTVVGSTVSGTFSAAGSPTVTLTETLAGATNTPRATPFSFTVSAAAPSGYEGLVATRGVWNTGTFGSAGANAMCISAHKATSDISAIKLAWGNYTSGGGAESVSGRANGLTVVDCAIEYPIGAARQRITFGAGSNSGSVNAGATLFSDMVTLTGTIPKGADFRIWAYYTHPNAGIPMKPTGRNTTANGDVARIAPGANTVMSGAAPAHNFAASAFVAPTAIIGVTTQRSFIGVGTSIMESAYDYPTTDFRACVPFGAFPDDVAFLNLAISASNSTGSMTMRSALFPYCSDMINEHGINESMTSTTAATLATRQAAVAALFPARVKKWLCTIGPGRSTGTLANKYWTDPTTYAASSEQPNINTYNDLVRAGSVSPYDGYFEVSDLLSSARNSGKWATTPQCRQINDAQIVSGSLTLVNSATANFTSADVGKAIAVAGAHTGGADALRWITAVNSSTQCVLNAGAILAVSGATAFIGGLTYEQPHPAPAGNDLLRAAANAGTLFPAGFFTTSVTW